MSLGILIAALCLGLVVVPFGLPGTWLMVAAAIAYGPLTGTEGVGLVTIVGTLSLALIAEIAEHFLSLHYTSRFGGSRRAGWGAIAGGLVGAIVGVPLPIVGSLVGAFVGAFLGALVAELTVGATGGAAARAARGALLGRAAGIAVKSAAGVVIAVWVVRSVT